MNDEFWQNWLTKRGRGPEPRQRYDLPDEAATVALAQLLAPQLQPGDVVALDGDLGVGKTAFTSALALALGLPDEVASPTFIMIMEHEDPAARLNLYHFDVYRLTDEADFIAAGLDEYFDRGGVCVIEWPERIAGLLPKHTKLLRFCRLNFESEARRVDLFD